MSEYSPAFNAAFVYLLSNEGDSFVKLQGDAGGATKFGITAAQFPDVDISSLDLEKAKFIYYAKPPLHSPVPFWVPNYEKILYQRVATKIFDMAVNMGPGTTHEIVQAALGMKTPTQIFGTVTLGMVNGADQTKLLSELCARSAVNYAKVLMKHPEDEAFVLDWMRRAIKLP